MKHLFETARARNLDRVTIGYTVAAWAVVQAAALAGSAFAWPNLVVQGVIIGAVIGLPAVLLGAWALAVRKETGSVFRPTRNDLHVLGTLSVILVLAGVVFVTVFWPRKDSQEHPSGTAPASVAVLPFANIGGDPSKRYFSDGLSEELINDLARIPNLRVAARTSSFAFEGKKADAKTIARALNVHAILEGSVREAGNRVRIAAQLVNGSDGFQMWSDSYDREVRDILALQDEIAHAVTAALSIKLLGGRQAEAKPIDPEAYRLYLQGKFYSDRDNIEDLEHAIGLFKRTNALAPAYAPAFAEAASAQLELAEVYGKQSWLTPAETSARKAVELDPANLQALTVLAQIAIDKWDWPRAMQMLREARAINANNIYVLHLESVLANIFQRPKQMLEAEKKAARLDPLSFGLKFNIAQWYNTMGRYREARAAIREAQKIQPTNLDARSAECLIALRSGRLAEAKRLAAQLAPAIAKDPQNFADCPFEIALAERNTAQARRLLNASEGDFAKNGGYATAIGDNYRKLGDLGEAMKWYERGYELREVLLLAVPYERRQNSALLKDPRWKALWAREPIRAWQGARTRFSKDFAS